MKLTPERTAGFETEPQVGKLDGVVEKN